MTKNKENNQSIEEALIDIYLSVKIRKQEEIENLDTETLEQEKETLKKTSPFTIIEYIKNSIDILINLKVEERLEQEKNSGFNGDADEKQNEYEVLLRKLESDIRSHIKIEHQLKLYSEGLQQKIEELEKENEEKEKKFKQIKEQLSKQKKDSFDDKKEIEINELKKEVSNYKQILKSYEEQNLKIIELEKRLRNQNLKSEKDIKSLGENYEEKIKNLNKKIILLEERIKTTSNFKFYNSKNEDINKSEKYDSSVNENSVEKNHTKMTSISSIDKKLNYDIPKKIQHYKKIIDKKSDNYSSMTNRTNNSIINKSVNKNEEERSFSNKSHLVTKDKSMNETSKASLKYNSFLNNIENATKKVLGKEKFKSHQKQNSMDIKLDRNRVNLPYKNIQLVKEILINQSSNNTNSSSNLNFGSKDKKSLSRDNKNDTKKNFSSTSKVNSNSLLNQNGLVCFNNINIYNTNKNTNLKNPKNNDINLRQYLLNKVSNEKTGNKLNISKHGRSNSNNLLFK